MSFCSILSMKLGNQWPYLVPSSTYPHKLYRVFYYLHRHQSLPISPQKKKKKTHHWNAQFLRNIFRKNMLIFRVLWIIFNTITFFCCLEVSCVREKSCYWHVWCIISILDFLRALQVLSFFKMKRNENVEVSRTQQSYKLKK